MTLLSLAAVTASCKEAPKPMPEPIRQVVATPRATTRPTSPPTPRPTAQHSHAEHPVAVVSRGDSIWDCIALHESGSNWQDVSHEGTAWYYGGLHFLESTWISAGGQKYAAYPNQATREEQIAIAQSWLERTSWEQWPNTSRICGVR